MILISPSTWPYGGTKPKSLLNGNRCVYLYDSATRVAIQKAGVPWAILTLQDYCVLHDTHRGPTGDITFPTTSQITDNLP